MSNPYEPLQVRGADPSPKRERGVLHRSLALPARIRVGGLWPIGVIAALLYGLWQAAPRWLRRQLADRPFTALASALTIGLFLYELAPFDFVTDTAGLHASFGRARWDLTSACPLAFGDPAFASMGKQLTGAAWFAALGYLFAIAGRRSGRHPATATALAITDGFVLACLLECMQLFTLSHQFDLAVIVLRALAVTFGAWCAGFVVDGLNGSGGWHAFTRRSRG